MSRFVLLDTGPLGQVVHPHGSDENQRCHDWMVGLLAKGVGLRVPEICDYELRRELLRLKLSLAVDRLDELRSAVGFLPITSDAMKKAAELWAMVRHAGRPTADPQALDCDVILAAQALVLEQEPAAHVTVASCNVGHLEQLVRSKHWAEIK